MITYVTGDLFTSPAKVLVNTVNTVGVMGKGIAKTFKAAYPGMFERYQQLCEQGQFTIGTLWIYRTNHKWVLNFPTKKHWRNPSKPEYIEAGLNKFVATYASQGITSIAFPRLGCGNGELDWTRTVEPLMKRYLDKLPIDVFVHHVERGRDVPEHKNISEMNAWLRSDPRALPFEEMWGDLFGKIRAGLVLRAWGPDVQFRASIGDEGLRVSVGGDGWPSLLDRLAECPSVPSAPRVLAPGEIQIPRSAFLDLWQSVRAYGFCIPRIMPAELDAFGGFAMAVLALLPYMKPVSLSTPSAKTGPVSERGLQLFPSAGTAPDRGLFAPPSFSVHPA
jgi:O-acetyl-ADP-ribose deacetylase (regulator of RNase III)